MTTARAARAEDIDGIAEALVRSFHDDPVMSWLFGAEPAKKQRRMRGYFKREVRRHLGHDDVVFTADGLPGAACWDPPDRWRIPVGQIARHMPFFLWSMGPRVPRALRGLAMVERAHAKVEAHYYLALLGTATEHQGKGIGTAMLQPILDRCDREGIGAYLESSKDRNVPYYRRHGFDVVEEIQLPKGPPIWTMWRDPR
jgi:GNAT superfamily N-acetyltransferase